MSTFAQLEADLFLAERAFKRVPSEENEAALAKVRAAFDKVSQAKDSIKQQPKAPAATKTTPAKPASTAPAKAAVPKAAAKNSKKTPAVKTEDTAEQQDTKKN